MKLISRILLIASTLSLGVSCAGDYNGATPSASDKKGSNASASLKERLANAVGAPPDSITPSQVTGILEAKWGSNFAYVTEDGRYAVFGDMVNLETQEEITENSRRGSRIAALKELGEENMIEFSPESPRYVVTVFTDVDCGYCRMLHRQVKEFNAQGIAIRYVFFPRTGPDTESFHKAEAVWCAPDRKAALTDAKNGAAVNGPVDCINPVRREWELGQKFGLRGTPLLILPDGETIAGYVPPAELSARLAAMETRKQARKD